MGGTRLGKTMKAQASVWFSRLVMGLALTACFSSSRGLAQKLVGPLPPARGDVVEPSIAKCDKDAGDYYNTAYMAARDSVTRSQIETLDYPEIVATQKRKLKACVQTGCPHIRGRKSAATCA